MKELVLNLLDTLKGWNSDMSTKKELPFSIIPFMYERISTKELLHSGIIAELLRPNGKHGYGDVFLQEFMRSIGIDPQAQDFSAVEVKTEVSTDESRRIDILIVWGNNAVIIENKLNNAVDRPDQLKDYLEDTENKGKNVLKVVYVPLFAWKRVQEYISAEVEYLYPQKLSAWLNACVARSPDAREVASPYIRLLDYMDQSNQNYMKAQELYDILKQEPERMNTVLNLAETIDSSEWTKFLFEQICDEVKNRLNESEFWHKSDGKTSEWLHIGGPEIHKYWVSVDIWDGRYHVLYYCYDEREKPRTEDIEKGNCGNYKGYYYYELSESYRIGDDGDFEKLIAKVVELLEKSKK